MVSHPVLDTNACLAGVNIFMMLISQLKMRSVYRVPGISPSSWYLGILVNPVVFCVLASLLVFFSFLMVFVKVVLWLLSPLLFNLYTDELSLAPYFINLCNPPPLNTGVHVDDREPLWFLLKMPTRCSASQLFVHHGAITFLVVTCKQQFSLLRSLCSCYNVITRTFVICDPFWRSPIHVLSKWCNDLYMGLSLCQWLSLCLCYSSLFVPCFFEPWACLIVKFS